MSLPFQMLAQSGSSGGGIFVAVVFIIYLALIVAVIAGGWKTYEKAGQPGWGFIVPIYNLYLICKITGRPWWWLILALIPFVGVIVALISFYDLARSFGKGAGFTLGLIFLGFIFIPILGFGSAEYEGPAAAA
ncbi:MAG: DUF5684 domain-containing protein [Planctomycetota bacterium]